MININKELKHYWPFTRVVIQTMMSYRINFLLFLTGNLFKTFIMVYLWKAIYSSSPSNYINNFSLNDMIIYTIISNIVAITIQNSVDNQIGNEVKNGSIIMQLIKPINYKLRMLFIAIGNFLYGFIFVFTPIWIGLISMRYIFNKEVPPSIFTLLLFTTSLILGFLINYIFNFCYGLLAFYVTNIWGTAHIKGAILLFFTGQLIPIPFFPTVLQRIINIFPFSSLNYIPVMIYLNKITGAALIRAFGIQIFWIIVLYGISVLLWNKVINRLVVFGG